MGFFENIIADSRLPLRANPTMVASAADPGGTTPNLWQADDMQLSRTEHIVDEPASRNDAVPVPSLSVATANDSPIGDVRESAQSGTTRIAQLAPVSSNAMAPDEADTSSAGDVRPGQLADSLTRVPIGKPAAAERPGSDAAVPNRVQRQIGTPDAKGVLPTLNGNLSPQRSPVMSSSSPQDSPPTASSSSTLPGSTRAGVAPRAKVDRSGQGLQTPTPQIPAAPESPADKATEREQATGKELDNAVMSTQVKPMLGRHHSGPQTNGPAAAAPSLPLDHKKTFPSESPGSMPRAPQVRIGQVNVIVEGPAAMTPPSPANTAEDPSSRLFLRSL